MPHPADFLQRHSSETERIGQAICLNCHLESDCANCHFGHVHPGGGRMP
jgi:hypothetical protein